MNDKVDDYKKLRSSHSVKFFEFVRSYSRNPNLLFCFFEGDDAKYYASRIQMHAGFDVFEQVIADGKSTILTLIDRINQHSEYRKSRRLFFIDKDFDDESDLPKHSNVFITKVYSVENYYTSCTAIRRILQQEFSLNDAFRERESLKDCLALVMQRQKEYHNAIGEFNAWIYLNRKLERNSENSEHKLNLGNLRMGCLVGIDIDYIEKKYTIYDVETNLQGAKSFPQDEIDSILQGFDSTKYGEIFRGKFEMFFVCAILNQLSDDSRSKTPKYCFSPRKIKVSFTDSNFLSLCSHHADTPEDLVEFLNRNKRAEEVCCS